MGDWGCFVAEIEEREPAFIATVGRELWALGSDGAFLAPVGTADDDVGFRLLKAAGERPKILRGLSAGTPSPNGVAARFQFVHEALAVIERETRRTVADLSLEQSGELLILFRDADFQVRFDGLGDDMERLMVEAQRLAALLAEIQAELPRVSEIDLAFERLAVVKFAKP